MRTKRIEERGSNHPGYGAGSGDTEWYEFECVCGNGSIIEEHDNIPGSREHSVYIKCELCREKYEVDLSKGIRTWELVEKESK